MTTFRTFISWSGETSHAIAILLKGWLPSVLPFLSEPWISPQIEPGKVGVQVIMTTLRDADAGIVVLTPQSQIAPWVVFESGALAVNERFIPYVVGIPRGELRQPFPHFQFREATRADTVRIVEHLNSLAVRKTGVSPLPPEAIHSAFDSAWGELERQLMPLVEQAKSARIELQYGIAAPNIMEARIEAAEQKARAEREAYRAAAFKATLMRFQRYRMLMERFPPERLPDMLEAELRIVDRVIELDGMLPAPEVHYSG